MNEFGKTLVFIGIVLILIGVLSQFIAKIPWFGKLPGDIYIKKENFTFYFPLATSILVSVLLSLIFYLWNKR